MSDAFPLLRAKESTYQGKLVYTAVDVEPCAWACGKCGKAFKTALAKQMAVLCCRPPTPLQEAIREATPDGFVPNTLIRACEVCGWGENIHGDGAGVPHPFTPSVPPAPYDD